MIQPQFDTLIIGAGFSGIGMAVRMMQNGFNNFVIIERASDVGGVWRDNSYPGCACDVESHLYSFSFAPNSDWSHVFSGQKEIWEYLKKCAKDFNVLPHIRFNTEFKEAHYDEVNQFWKIQTSQGEITARVFITGVGAFSEPLYPNLPGLENFQGKTFHSAKWDHSYDLKNKNVAVIGTGASAIQFVPEIQPLLKKLSLFQRTAAWVLPRFDRPISKREKDLYRAFPALRQALRLRYYLTHELFGITFREKRWIGFAKKFALHHLKKAIKDPELQKKLTPPYTIGCKRILISNDYFPALAKENVEVITDAIQEIRAHSVVSADGVEHPVDAIIFGTGFKVTEFSFAANVYGKSGLPISEKWLGSPKAFLGTSAAGFPNLFFLLGPNTGLGHTSVVLMIEAQIEHIIKILHFLKKNSFKSIEPLPTSENKFVESINEKSKGTVWLDGGCKSWYLDQTGRNSSLWPSSVGSFKRTVIPFKSEDYHATK